MRRFEHDWSARLYNDWVPCTIDERLLAIEDCDRDHDVLVAEHITAISIALLAFL